MHSDNSRHLTTTGKSTAEAVFPTKEGAEAAVARMREDARRDATSPAAFGIKPVHHTNGQTHYKVRVDMTTITPRPATLSDIYDLLYERLPRQGHDMDITDGQLLQLEELGEELGFDIEDAAVTWIDEKDRPPGNPRIQYRLTLTIDGEDHVAEGEDPSECASIMIRDLPGVLTPPVNESEQRSAAQALADTSTARLAETKDRLRDRRAAVAPEPPERGRDGEEPTPGGGAR